jgi:hypothetical protein
METSVTLILFQNNKRKYENVRMEQCEKAETQQCEKVKMQQCEKAKIRQMKCK